MQDVWNGGGDLGARMGGVWKIGSRRKLGGDGEESAQRGWGGKRMIEETRGRRYGGKRVK